MAEQKFQTFYPGQYSPEEQAALDGLLEKVRNAGGVGPMSNRTITVEKRDMKAYSWLWNPYDPLYNDPEYGKNTRWGAMPAMPCFAFKENIAGFPMMDEVGDDLGNIFYYANDGGDVELYQPVFEGDRLTFRSTVMDLTDTTPAEGSTLRQFSLHGEGELRNQRGELVGYGKGYGRNAMMRVLEGYVPTEYEQTYEWIDNIPPVHVTTPEEWKQIEELWKGETVRGAETLWWEQVEIGDQLTPVCSGPISDLDMMRLHGEMIMEMPSVRDMIMGGEVLMEDSYGQRLNFMGRHYSYCRNPKARAVFYNFTARNFILRMVTNWMGDDGFLTAFRWRFQNLYECMSHNRPGADILDKVPSMRGKCVNRHGMEGDCAICHGEVTAKYVKDGRHLVDVTCWAETLDGDILQVVDTTVELLAKEKGE